MHRHYIKSNLQQPGCLFHFDARSENGEMKPRILHSATVEIVDDGGFGVAGAPSIKDSLQNFRQETGTAMSEKV